MKKCWENKYVLYSFSLTISIIIFLSANAFGQKLAPKNIINKDAMTAIEIRDSIIHPSVPTVGTLSSYWYKFIPKKDTLLIFDLVAIDPEHHYGFSVYQYEKANGTTNKKPKLKGVRAVYSTGYFNPHGPRGLSLSAKKDTLQTTEGYTQSYVKPLPIKAGDSCYIVVDWTFANSWEKGFKLYLYDLWPNKPKRLKEKPVVKPKEIVLENVLFEINKSTLLKESYASLDILVNQLVSQKTMTIDIKGHTDNVGDETKNQGLSEKRAKAVFDYLISKKISPGQLYYHGLGSKEPIASNETEEGRKKNRRVAFIVVTK
ncbi:MAG: OmpA family protein [Bacteroidota bacterium]